MEVLSHDVVEHILERVPAKSLVRFKRVSKLWKSTIESKNFQERQLIHRQQYSRDVLCFFSSYDDDDDDYTESRSSSPSVTLVKFPSMENFYCSNSCDGLICLYDVYTWNIVINPTTRWHRTLPVSNFQQRRIRSQIHPKWYYMLGFGKDKFNGAYKIVWLYDSLDNSNTTTCEVFDFSTNAWRYVTNGCPYEILDRDIVYIDGLFYWLTACEETKVLSFNLHTETFDIVAKAPFVHEIETTICNLKDRLCISEKECPNHVIWLFDSDSKTWSVMYSLTDWYTSSYPFSWGAMKLLFPQAVLEKDKLLFYDPSGCRNLVTYDCQTKSFELVSEFDFYVWPVCYFQSLISIP